MSLHMGPPVSVLIRRTAHCVNCPCKVCSDKIGVVRSFDVNHNIKASHNSYLEGLLGLTDENSVCNNKTLFSFLKSSKQDQTGSPPFQKGSRLVTDTTEKADIHNQQFQSVFTTKAPKSLSRLCKMKIQDMTASGKMRHDPEPAELLNSNPKMEEFSISCNGI